MLSKKQYYFFGFIHTNLIPPLICAIAHNLSAFPEYLRFYIALNNNSCEPFTQDRQVSSLYEDEENIHI